MSKNSVSIDDLIPIDLSILKVGGSLPYDLYSAKGKLLSSKDYVFKSEFEISGVSYAKPMRLKKEGESIDDKKAPLDKNQPPVKKPSSSSAQDQGLDDTTIPTLSSSENLSNVKPENIQGSDSIIAMINQLLKMFQKLYRAIHSKSESALELLAEMDEIVFRIITQDVDSAIGVLHMTKIKSQAEHCVFAAILAAIYSKTIGYPDRSVRLVTSSAFCMNLGAIKLHHELNSSDANLSKEMLAEIRKHSNYGVALMENVGIRHPTIINAVLHHHERPDGSGYPDGLQSPEIADEALILGLVDTYLAMIAPRAYRQTTQPKEALKQVLFEGHKYDVDFYTSFIKAIGVFPAGTFHKLSSGEVAVVTRRDPLYSTRPEVCVLLDAKGQPVKGLTKRRLIEIEQTIKSPYTDIQSLNIKPSSLWR